MVLGAAACNAHGQSNKVHMHPRLHQTAPPPTQNTRIPNPCPWPGSSGKPGQSYGIPAGTAPGAEFSALAQATPGAANSAAAPLAPFITRWGGGPGGGAALAMAVPVW